jgi:molybdenum cofactor guanylyltransferase
MNNPALKGLVLNGGKSSRMGMDKGEIVYHEKPQREFLYELLRRFCTDVFISCKSLPANVEGFNFLPDQFNIHSPLNGILSAFKKDPASAWITVPVDMPGVDEGIIRFLVTHRDTSSIATCFLDDEGKKPEPLVTIWEPECASLLKEFFTAGNISPREFLMQHQTKQLIAPNGKFHQNINTPRELKNFRDS